MRGKIDNVATEIVTFIQRTDPRAVDLARLTVLRVDAGVVEPADSSRVFAGRGPAMQDRLIHVRTKRLRQALLIANFNRDQSLAEQLT